MKQVVQISVLSLSLGFAAGCLNSMIPLKETSNTAPSAKTTAPSAEPSAPVATPPAAEPSEWKQGQVEEWLKQQLALAELSLKAHTAQTYTGVGRDASGKVYQLKVTQSPSGIVCDHTSGPGSSGQFALGNSLRGPGYGGQGPASPQSPDGVQIPDRPVTGRIHGREFTLEKAVLENGVLTLRQGKDLIPDLALDVMMFLKEGESAEGKRIRIAADQGPGKPLLRLQWRKQPGQGLPENEHFNTNYLLIVELGRIQSGKLPGKIHVSVPDAEKSSLSGTFVLEGLR